MKREIVFLKEIAIQAENFYNDSKGFGNWAAECPKLENAQMKSLENISNSTLKVTDVLDYLKKQTAKDGSGESWKFRNADKNIGLGASLIDHIGNNLSNVRDSVCNNSRASLSSDLTNEDKQFIYISLIREFVKQVVAQYSFKRGS